MKDPFVGRVARGLAALCPPPRLLLAVSGGADSVALLDALAEGHRRSDLRELQFVVGHFDHGLRPDSARDAALVAELAQERDLPCAQRRETVSVPRGESLEQAAREQRYAALTALAEEAQCQAIVTAHTATDQAETLLLRLMRGAGTRGLGGMRPARRLGPIQLLRPLLGISREETRAYCARRQLRFHDDPTNVDERPRARLRAEVLPVLERLSSGAVFKLAAATARLREDDDYLNELAAEHLPAGVLQAEAAARLPNPLLSRVLAQWLELQLGTRQRVSSAHLEALVQLVRTGQGEVELPADVSTHRVAMLVRGVLVLGERTRVKSDFEEDRTVVKRETESGV